MPDVDRLPSGRWQARWRDDLGKQRKKSFRTKAMAAQFLADVQHAKARGHYIDERAGRTLLREYAEQWAASRPWRLATRRRVETSIRVHIAGHPIGGLPMSAIRPSDVQGWATSRSALLAPSTTRQLVKLLRSIFLAAVEDKLIAASPARRIALPTHTKPRIVALTVEQVRRLSDSVPPRCRAMVIAQAGLGLRIGELLALRVEDVDFLRRTVRVQAQIRQLDRVRVEPKTARSNRTVPLPQVVADAIAWHLSQYPAGDDGTLFATRTGRPHYQSHYASRVMARSVAQAGLPKGTTTHDLRHHYVSVMLDAGASVAEVADLIGDTVTTVVEAYAHLVPGNEDRARSRIDSAWCAPSVPSEQVDAP